MTDYAAVLELINAVGEEHPQLPFMLKALGVEAPEQFITEFSRKQGNIPPPDSSQFTEKGSVYNEFGAGERAIDESKAERPLWSFPIVVVESYELHDATNSENKNKPLEDIKPLPSIKISTDELIAFDNKHRLSLWPKWAVKNGLHQFLEHVQNHQQLDIPKLAVQMAQKQPLNELPFLQTHKLPAEFWLYVDKTQGAHCFHDDYLALYHSLQTHVGPLGIAQTVELLEAKPNHFAGGNYHCHWRQSAKFEQYYEYNIETNPLPVPETGSCVIICAPKSALTADALTTKRSVWLTFAEQLKQQQVTVLFVPLDFSQANTNPAIFKNQHEQIKKPLKEQEEFLMSALSLMPHRISLALIRALRCQFTQLGPEVELSIINNAGVNWWHSQNIGHWFEGTSHYQETLITTFTKYANRNPVYSNRFDLFNAVYRCIENNIPKELTSFIIEFNVLVLLHAKDLLDKEFQKTLEQRVAKYYQQATQSIKQATENHSIDGIIDETQFWLSQALRLNLPELPLEIIPKELRKTVTSAKHYYQQSTQQDIPEVPILDDDYYRELNKEKLNNHNPGVLVLSQNQLSTKSQNQTDNSKALVGLELLTQEQTINVENGNQKNRSQQNYNQQVIANLQSAELFSTAPAINNTKQFQLTQGATLTLKTLKETLTLKAYSSNDFYWAKSIQQTPQGVKATAEQFEIHWRNPNPNDSLLLRDLLEVIVYENAPQWLHDFPPQIDNYGIFSEITVENIPFKMRYIPSGGFLMGSPKDEPERNDNEQQHPVRLTHGFWLAETTVTQAFWMAVMGENPSSFNPKTNGKVKNNTEAELPVDSVSWDDCKQFFNILEQYVPGLRLTFPSEAQWEYACRAGTQTPFNTGNNLTTHQANYDGNYPYDNNPKGNFLDKTLPVVSFQPNTWGMYQMHGNLWEWCLDEVREYPQQAENVMENPIGPISNSGAALRGGSWFFSAWRCRSAARGASERDFRYSSLGVRPCSTIDQLEQPEAAGEPLASAQRAGRSTASPRSNIKRNRN